MDLTGIQPTRNQNYSQWYQQVIAYAELAESSPARGSMVIKPWGYALWEIIQRELDDRLKATGHVNAYFPLLIPLHLIEKEAQHIAGFAKECAVVTHHCLRADADGRLHPEGLLEEPYIIRPTSEAMIGTLYARWIQSWRDLPILINQWANVMRWEMRTRLFLRTSEFLWQEGHTAHATAQEAQQEALMILDLYQEFVENVLALSVIKGEKTKGERFPGALTTHCIEAMMYDRKALQAGTSHFLGQNFAKAYDIRFTDQTGQLQSAWTTSWGVSTRLIGAVIMTHSDDHGLVLPPTLAPYQIVILPIYRTPDDQARVLAQCQELKETLSNETFRRKPIRVFIDDRPLRGGDKNWQWIKKGVPIRLEIGPRDLDNDTVCIRRRDQACNEKQILPKTQFIAQAANQLNAMQNQLLAQAHDYRRIHTHEISCLPDFIHLFAEKNQPGIQGGFALCYADDNEWVEKQIKALGVTARCIPYDQDENEGACIFTGKIVRKKTVFAKAY